MKTYRQAVSYLTEIYVQVWEELREIPETKKRFNACRAYGTHDEEKYCPV